MPLPTVTIAGEEHSRYMGSYWLWTEAAASIPGRQVTFVIESNSYTHLVFLDEGKIYAAARIWDPNGWIVADEPWYANGMRKESTFIRGDVESIFGAVRKFVEENHERA